MKGGTLRIIWIGDYARRSISLDVKSRVDALKIALAIYDGAEDKPNRAEWQTETYSEHLDL